MFNHTQLVKFKMNIPNRTIVNIAFMLLLTASLLACGGGSGPGEDPVPPSTQTQLQGVWEKTGYGLVLNISGSTVTGYDYTSNTCARQESEDLAGLVNRLGEVSNNAFTLKDAPIGFVENYAKIDRLPVVCDTPIGSRPTDVFEHVWHTFNDYYAFFVERDVDWLAQYDSVRNDVYDGMSDIELFDALSALVAPIDDVHVKIAGPTDQPFSPGTPKGFFQDFIAEFEAQTDVTDVQAYFAQELNTALAIIDTVYLDSDFAEGGGPSNDFFKWGFIGDDIGYLSIGAFILQFDRSIADQLVEVEDVIDQVLTDLASAQSLIVDVRLTPGGADPIALAIASRFADIERMVMRKQTRTVEGDGLLQTLSLAPSPRVKFAKPVVVLTSGFSASATEVFTLAMRSMPHVSVVGEPTIGALSDILEKPLPNGWQFELANEVYYDADGTAFEAVGIPPDVEVPAFAKPERETGQDSALNAALTLLGFDFG